MKFLNINFESLILKSKPFLYLFFLVLVCTSALSLMDRWVLNEQIAMGDNYIKNGNFYPSMIEDIGPGVSPYFPGIAFFSVLFNKIGFDYFIVEIMLIFSSLIFIVFVFFQKNIINDISNKNFKFDEILPFAIFFTLLLCPTYFFAYALAGKPDTIAFLFGYIGIYFYLKSRNQINFNFIFSFLFVGIAVIFKQQYLSFLAGLLLFSLINFNRKSLIFALASIFISAIALFILFQSDDAVYWNLTILSDDGFRELGPLVKTNLNTIINLALFFILLLVIINTKDVKDIFNYLNLKALIKTPWIYVIVMSFFSSFLSSLKHGGNIGNTELGIFLFFPILFLMYKVSSKYKIIALAWFILLPQYQNVYFNVKDYLKANEIKSFVNQLEIKPGYKVLTGSNIYFASRLLLKKGADLDSYVTAHIRNNSDKREELSNSVKLKNYNILIVENKGYRNLEQIKNFKEYNILFENDLGIVAEKIN